MPDWLSTRFLNLISLTGRFGPNKLGKWTGIGEPSLPHTAPPFLTWVRQSRDSEHGWRSIFPCYQRQVLHTRTLVSERATLGGWFKYRMPNVRDLCVFDKVPQDQSRHKYSRGARSSGSPKKLIMILYYILHQLFGAARFEDGE